MNDALFPTALPPALRRIPALADLPGPGAVLKAVRGTLAGWRWRLRFRWELARKAEENPHLIEDIGLTREQVETETGKPFWRR